MNEKVNLEHGLDRGRDFPQKERDGIEAAAGFFKALGHSMRLSILRSLPRSKSATRNRVSVNDLSETLGVPQPSLSHHLKILREAGVIGSRKDGATIYYFLNAKDTRAHWGIFNSRILKK